MATRRTPRAQALTALALLAGSFAACVASCATGTGLGEATSTSSSSATSSSSTTSSTSSSTGDGGSSSSSTGTAGSVGGTGGVGGSTGGSGGSGVDAGTDAGDAGDAGNDGDAGDAGDAGTDAGDAGDSGTDAGDGGATNGVVLMLGGGGAQMLAGAFHPGAGWTTTTLADTTTDGLALALTGPTSGVGVLRSTSNAGELHFTLWALGSWAPPMPVSAGVTTRAAPSLAASGAGVSLAFHGDNFKHYYGAHPAGWSPVAEPIGGSVTQSFGPSPASIAALGADTVVAFAGNNNDLYDQTRTGGAWQAAQGHQLGAVVTLSPTMVALTGGGDLMIAFVRSTDARIVYTKRTGTVWTTPAPIDTNALSNDPVSLAALPGGEAVLGFRGQNGKVYWSRYKATATPPWTLPTGISAVTPATPSTPAVAAGAGGADAEMVFIDGATGAANHARLTGTTWTAPVVIGGAGLMHVAAGSNAM